MEKKKRAVIYARISTKDEQNQSNGQKHEKTADQIANLHKFAHTKGYVVVDVYEDDGIAASTAGKRPRFDAMMSDLPLGRFEVIIATEDERLARNDLETVGLKLACVGAGVCWDTIRDGMTDPSTAAGGFMATVKGAVSTYETKRKAERQLQANKNTRDKGLPYRSGARRFGWERDHITQREKEAKLIKSATEAVLAGRSVYSIVQDWNSSGVLTSRGASWNHMSVKSVLMRGSNAALVEHDGQVVKEGAEGWEPIVTRQQWEDVCTLLKVGGKRNTVTRLLSGIADCVCGEKLASNGSANGSYYACSARARGKSRPGAVHSSIAVDVLDDLAREAVVTSYLLAPKANDAADDEASRLAQLHDQLDAAKSQQATLLELYLADGATLTQQLFNKKNAQIQAREDELSVAIAQRVCSSAHAAMLVQSRQRLFSSRRISLRDAAAAKRELRDVFDGMSLEDKRNLVASAVNIVVMPGKGPGRVSITGGGISAELEVVGE